MATKMKNASTRTALALALETLLGIGFQAEQACAALPPSAACTGAGTGAVSCNLWAKTGTATLPAAGAATVALPFWGYADSIAGAASLPGPVLIANQGDTVTVNLTNNLAEATGLLFQGQSLVPDTTGAAPGGTKSYSFTATTPGTYLYEAGLLPNAQHQTALGLYGALVVRPAGAPAQAYGDAATAFDDEALVVLGELDSSLNGSANPAGFDMRNYAPKYFLINGKAHPGTAEIPAAAGQRILLRYVNGGIQHHAMGLLGLRQTVVARDGGRTLNAAGDDLAQNIVASTIAPGETVDALTLIPPTAVAGSKFALFDTGMKLNNSNTAGMGGMLTFLALGGSSPPPGSPPPVPTPPADALGPITSGLGLNPNPSNGTGSVALTATGNDTSTGGSNVLAAEYTIDGGAAQPMSVAAPGIVATASATLNAAPLSEAAHPITVRSQDAASNWGTPASISLMVDRTGPLASSVSATPPVTDGTQGYNANTPAVRLSASFTDALTNVVAAEGFIDNAGAAGTGFVFAAADGSFNSATETAFGDIPLTTVAQLPTGNHTLWVRGKDAAGNWGATNSTTLVFSKPGTVYFSTFGNTNPPGLGGSADDADIYFRNGTAFSRVFDATTFSVPGGANVDGYVRVDATHFYLSFSNPNTTLPGIVGGAQDEDVVYFDNGIWSVYFDGTGRNLTNNNQDLDAISIVGSNLYFSTAGNTNPPTVLGTADDADIYLWNGTAFSRVVDVTTIGVPASANVDGLKFIDASHFYLSFAADTVLPGPGAVQDEDVVYYNNGAWSIYFDGTARGLGTNDNLDIDAFDIP